MTDYIDKEIMDLQNNIKETELKLEIINREKTSIPENDLDVLIEEIVRLETSIESEKKRCNELSQLKEYQSSCEHSFIEDLIDIDPDRSKIIKYCSVCLFTCEN